MASVIYLKSEDELFEYLKKFLKENPKAVQLDGSPVVRQNSKVMVVFRYSVNSRKYKLTGGLTRQSAQEFVSLVTEHGSAGIVLKEFSEAKQTGLILSTHSKPDGWICLPFLEKASDKLKKAA